MTPTIPDNQPVIAAVGAAAFFSPEGDIFLVLRPAFFSPEGDIFLPVVSTTGPHQYNPAQARRATLVRLLAFQNVARWAKSSQLRVLQPIL